MKSEINKFNDIQYQLLHDYAIGFYFLKNDDKIIVVYWFCVQNTCTGTDILFFYQNIIKHKDNPCPWIQAYV